MAQKVRLPDGKVVAFPDDMPTTEIKALIAHKFPKEVEAQTTKKPEAAPAQPGVDLATATAATANGLVNGIPVIGPIAQGITDAIGGGIAQITGGSYDEYVNHQRQLREQVAEKAPVARVLGELGGSVGAVGAVAKIPAAAEALGMAGKFIPRVINSAASGAAISGADAAVRGEDPLKAAATGGAISAAVPVVGGALGQGARAVGNALTPVIGALQNPIKEGGRRLGNALSRDFEANAAATLGPADEAVAKANGVGMINADRGGETTRALARSVANQNPEARAVIEKTASDRFAGQAGRAANVMRKLVGGAADDLEYQKGIKDRAAAANKPAYDKAYSAPEAQAVFDQDLQELMQSDAVQRAISMTRTRGKDLAAIDGQVPVANPFRQGSDGKWRLVQKPDGSMAVPNLQFWDQVKQNVDSMIGTARRSGDDAEVRILTKLKGKLVGALDEAVPDYKNARATAASYFGEDDALEAGRKFANLTRSLPEARKAFGSLKPAEQDAFRVGFASEVIDKIKDARFRSNVIDQAFGSPAKREMMEIVFGKAKARELEAYIRVEEVADKLRGALGNSTTARQLMELSIGAGSGAALTGGDWRGALSGAALVKGGRYLLEKADGKVMQEVARLLTSDDPAAINRAVSIAAEDPQWMHALRNVEHALGVVSRGSVPAVAVGQN